MDTQMSVGSADCTIVLRLVGRGTMQESPAFRKAAEVALKNSDLVCDLSQCEYLDSTFLGCLIGVRKQAEQKGRALNIVADKAAQVRLFSTSSLDKYFDFTDSPPATSGDWMTIAPESLDVEAISRHVLVCHERLADRGGAEGKAFRRVCDRLSTEIEQHEMDKALRAAEGDSS